MTDSPHAVDVLNVYDAADRRIAFLAVCGCGWQRQTFNHQTARTLGKAHEVEDRIPPSMESEARDHGESSSVMAAMQAKADGDLEWWRKAPIGGGCHAEGCDETPAPGDDCSQEHYSDALQDAVLDAILYCVGVGEMPDLDDVEPWLWYDLYRREGEIRRSAERMEEMAMDEVPWVMEGGAL